MTAPLPIDHHGLPESYEPKGLTPACGLTLKDWLVAIVGAALIVAGVVVVLAIIQHLPLIVTSPRLVLEAIINGSACGIQVVDGVRVEHCIRTVWSI